MEENNSQTTSNKALDTLDKIHIIKNDIAFISNLLIAWNLDQSPITYTDLSGISRVCDGLNDQLGECEKNIEGFVKVEKNS